MQRTTGRRRFLQTGAVALVGSSFAGRAGAIDMGPPELVLVNANIHTVDPALPRARALAIKGDRIFGVGTVAQMRALAGKSTKIVDAGGATLLPGFIDCHLHPIGEILLYETLVGDPYAVEFVTIAAIQDKLRERAAKTPAGEWVRGFFYDDTKVRDGRGITRADLDAVSTEHPVFVMHRGGHSIYVNSKALELAGITRDSTAPSGGSFDRDAKGDLNGRVTDNAMAAFGRTKIYDFMTGPDRSTRALKGAAFMSQQFVRHGLTSVHHSGGDLAALHSLRRSGELLHRVNYEMDGTMIEPLIKGQIETGFGDEWLRIGATYEHQLDGSFSERTMALSKPYPGSNPPYQGNVTESQDALNLWVEKMYAAGVQPNIHANGDVAIGMALTAFERAQAARPRSSIRPKITHCTYINADLVRRIKATGAIPAPFTTYLYYNSDKFGFYGEDMLSQCMAYRSFLDAGIPVVAGSDFFPGPFSPLMGIQGMVTRTGWDGKVWGANQRISVAEAIRIYTINGAYASSEERIKGSITPGKLADFVLLADDPHSVAQDKIKDIRIMETYTGGRSVYKAS